MSHVDVIATTTRTVRESGAVAALDELRSSFGDQYHHTLAVFFVWAIDRLVDAGLTDVQILWHPLTDAQSPLAWYDRATLVSVEARRGFVASTLALPGEPAPVEPLVLQPV
ncbi:MAG: hypothetical protein ACOYL9_02330 [Ilumatobacteraceae bacterium]